MAEPDWAAGRVSESGRALADRAVIPRLRVPAHLSLWVGVGVIAHVYGQSGRKMKIFLFYA